MALGALAIALGIVFQNQNIAIIAALPMVVAASVNFPVLILFMYWEKMTTRGAIASAVTGFVSSIGLMVLGLNVWVAIFGFEKAIFPYDYPALFTAAWAVSVTDTSARATLDKSGFAGMLLRSELDHS